jgi:CheY-like chemotaxis protein
MHALIIEDEPIIAMGIEEVLRDCGCTSFDFAGSFASAVAAAERRCPDLITADVRLAPGNGIDAVQAICCRTHIPVVFITGTGAEARARCPGYAVVDKPFAAAAVGVAVRAAISPPH